MEFLNVLAAAAGAWIFGAVVWSDGQAVDGRSGFDRGNH
jgi:hypothetical protein